MIENAVSVQGSDGAYYHHLEVCKLLKLQQQGYTEQEVLDIIIEFSEWQLPQTGEDILKIKEWFEQFRKK